MFKILGDRIQEYNLREFQQGQILALYARMVKPFCPVLIAFIVMIDLMCDVVRNRDDLDLVKAMLMRWAFRQKRNDLARNAFKDLTDEMVEIDTLLGAFTHSLHRS